MDLELNGKNVLITGASKNIGKAIAMAMAKENSNITICARNQIQLDEVFNIIDQYSGKHQALCLDLESKDGPLKLLEYLNLNKISPDIIIHNLGGSLQVTNPNFSRKDFESVWQLNIGIAHEINHYLIPNMIKNNWGKIIHISSLVAKTRKGYVPYVSAKCALEGYVTSMSKLLSDKNIIMSAIAPGLVELPERHFTKMKNENPKKLNNFYDEHLPIRKMLQPQEIADLFCFLCSQKSNYMSGAIIPIDGGGS